jgi:cobalamin biosynthesis Mg chelatase CobN
MRKKLIAALLLGAAVALAAPAAANAEPYTKGASCSISPITVAAGSTTTFTCSAGTFQPSESVAYTVSGENGSNASLASYRTSISSAHATKISSSNGGSVLRITVPTDATGAYTVTGTGATSHASSAATVTVVPADAPAGTTASGDGSSTSATGSSTIASTGSVVSSYVAWIGGALVFLGLIALLIVAAARRRHANP